MSCSSELILTLLVENNMFVCKPPLDMSNEEEKSLVNHERIENILVLQPTFGVTASVSNVKFLDLSNCNLKEVSSSVSKLFNLQRLNLSRNKLSVLPNSFSQLKNIQILDLSHNCFEVLPSCICELNFIINLNLSYNPMEAFDSPPNCLNFLKVLNLSNLKLTNFPDWMFLDDRVILEDLNLSGNTCLKKEVSFDILFSFQHSPSFFSKTLKKFTAMNCILSPSNLNFLMYFSNLEVINIGNDVSNQLNQVQRLNNILWDVPPSLLSNLDLHTSLVSLNISNASVSILTEDIYLLSALRIIDVSHNELDWLPNNFTLLVNLEECNLSNNRLAMLPSNFSNLINLKVLLLNNNQIHQLPKKFEELVNLQYLDLYHNHLEEFPFNVFDCLKSINLKGFDAAWNYCDLPSKGASADSYLKLQENLRQLLRTFEIRETQPCPLVEDISVEISEDHESGNMSSSSSDYTPEFLPQKFSRESEDEEWDNDSYFNDSFDPNNEKLLSNKISPANSVSGRLHFLVDFAYPNRFSEKMAFCPSDLHAVAIRPYRKIASGTHFSASDQFADY